MCKIMVNLRVWFAETRPITLLYTVTFVLLGASLAIFELSTIRILDLAITVLGALLAHISVNVLDDYFDYKSGIDLKSERTSLSGGSGILISGVLKPKSVYYFGIACLIGVLGIGAYFTATLGIKIIIIGLIGIALVASYTNYLAKIGLGEFACGLGFALMSLGTYVVQVGGYSTSILLVAAFSGVLMWNALLMNESPDIEADRFGKRLNIPIIFGLKKSLIISLTAIMLTYVYLIVLVVARYLPITALAALATLPLEIIIMRGLLKYPSTRQGLEKYLKMNFLITLLFPLLISIGLIAWKIQL